MSDKAIAEIENIWLDKNTNEIRIDWSNDRHQAVKIKCPDFYGVRHAFAEAIHQLQEDKFNLKI